MTRFRGCLVEGRSELVSGKRRVRDRIDGLSLRREAVVSFHTHQDGSDYDVPRHHWHQMLIEDERAFQIL